MLFRKSAGQNHFIKNQAVKNPWVKKSPGQKYVNQNPWVKKCWSKILEIQKSVSRKYEGQILVSNVVGHKSVGQKSVGQTYVDSKIRLLPLCDISYILHWTHSIQKRVRQPPSVLPRSQIIPLFSSLYLYLSHVCLSFSLY